MQETCWRVSFVLWTCKNFVGMYMDIFMGIGKFCGYCVWIYLCVLANFVGIVEKFDWVCENLFVHEVVGIFSWTCRNFLFAWLWQNLVIVWICDKFGSGDILVRH